MKKYDLIYTPQKHIPMAVPLLSSDGNVLLCFKKAKEPVYETVLLDDFLRQVCDAVKQPPTQAAQERQPQNQ